MKNHRITLGIFSFLLAFFFLACNKSSNSELTEEEAIEFESEEYYEEEYEAQPDEDYREYREWVLPFTQQHLLELYSTTLSQNTYFTDRMQTEGVNGMIYGSHINYDLSRYLGAEGTNRYDYAAWNSVEGFETLSGLSARERNDEFGFDYYNPDFVNWGIENIVPEPNNVIGTYLAQEIYDQSLSRFFRINADAYLWLLEQGYPLHQGQYVDAMGTVDFEGTYYLERRYRGVLPEYVDEETFYYGDWTPEIAIGFWLRRGLDGTSDELWAGLNQLLNTYDTEWWVAKVSEDSEAGKATGPPAAGTYYRIADPGELVIESPNSDNSFKFSLSISSEHGDCGGEVAGIAHPNELKPGFWEYDDVECSLSFQKQSEEEMRVLESGDMCSFRGDICIFDADYAMAKE